MSEHILRCEMAAAVPLKEAFAFFENPGNLAKITPPWLNFRIETPQVEIRGGAVIDYTIRWMGLPMRWRTLITDYEPPFRFVDVQTRGPYAMWRHEHSFRETPGGTVVADEVRYRLPLGPLGRLANWLLVRRQLEGIFRFRQAAIAKLLGSAESEQELADHGADAGH